MSNNKPEKKIVWTGAALVIGIPIFLVCITRMLFYNEWVSLWAALVMGVTAFLLSLSIANIYKVFLQYRIEKDRLDDRAAERNNIYNYSKTSQPKENEQQKS